jgi:hypothetical protein
MRFKKMLLFLLKHASAPVASFYRITDDGDLRITDDGDTRICT